MRTRRALSSVVGMVFAIIALSSTFVYITYSMNVLGNYNQQVVGQNHQLLDIGKEKLTVTGSTFVNNKFSITVTNTGNIPINLTKIWVQNMTALPATWNRPYNLTNTIVSPGSTLTNIGQTIPGIMNTGSSYHIKLVTARGNTQEFNVNSAASAPLSIQFLAAPNTTPSGFNTTLLMIVTNNGSSTLTNVSPLTPTPSRTNVATATCTLVQNQASPPSYNTLPPGGTAIFKWDLKVTGTVGGQSCMWGAQLQNPYPGNYANATVTITTIQMSSTNYAQNAGILTLNYTSFRWTQGGSWHTGWSFNSGQTVFSVTITNNNQTNVNVDSLWISKNTILTFFITPPPNNNVGTAEYIVKTVTLSPLSAGDYSPDYTQGVLNGGGTTTLYFASSTKSQNSIPTLSTNDYIGFISLYGKFSKNSGDSANTYAQNIPFIGVIVN